VKISCLVLTCAHLLLANYYFGGTFVDTHAHTTHARENHVAAEVDYKYCVYGTVLFVSELAVVNGHSS
jgi:hypothetical protein